MKKSNDKTRIIVMILQLVLIITAIPFPIGAESDAALHTQSNNVNGSFNHENEKDNSGNITNGITLEHSDVSITTIPVTSNSKTAAISSDSETVSYEIDASTRYEYKLTYMGYKEEIVVDKYTGQTKYDFKVITNGLELIKLNGEFCFVDKNNEIRATMSEIIRNNNFYR